MDESFAGAPELELAGAAIEWGDDEPRRARQFAGAYLGAGGASGDLGEEALAQLIRHKSRREAAYFALPAARGVEHDAGDIEYHRRRVALFHRLKP
ncbi:hypothetical protein [Spirillospora sp. CA-294931]|uniref:hypothetical protein n=1 Tax=Spirillospora sp. CA-294931 TaxID=3240042 RepID=UPI003D945775